VATEFTETQEVTRLDLVKSITRFHLSEKNIYLGHRSLLRVK